MALSFERKRDVLKSFTGLDEIPVGKGRYNYSYSGKNGRKKDIAVEVGPNNNGYVYVKDFHPINYLGNANGYASMDYFEEDDLRFLIQQIIELFSN